jgi:diacylglycerol kinase family enzyme
MNPRAGFRSGHERVQAIGVAIERAGYTCRMTADLSELAALASESWKSGNLRAVVAVGGDGTASVVRNHVPLEVPLLPVPLGTENLLGRYVGQATSPAAVCRTLDDGVTIGLDLGRAGDKFFLLMISAGFDAEVIRVLHKNRRGNITRLAYLLPTLRTIQSYEYPELRLYCEDVSMGSGEPVRCRHMFGFNLPLYGLGLRIAPDANATDGLLDVCTFERGSVWGVIQYLWEIVRGRHFALAHTALIRSRRFRLEAPGAANVAYQIDGDNGGELPVDVEVLPGELRLLVPRTTAQRLGFRLPEE